MLRPRRRRNPRHLLALLVRVASALAAMPAAAAPVATTSPLVTKKGDIGPDGLPIPLVVSESATRSSMTMAGSGCASILLRSPSAKETI
jgi:hypothetical protein